MRRAAVLECGAAARAAGGCSRAPVRWPCWRWPLSRLGRSWAGAPRAMRSGSSTRYATLWTRGDLTRMYGLLDSASRARVSPTAFAAEIDAAERTATVRSLRMLNVEQIGSGRALIRMIVVTHLWGTLHETLDLPLTGSGSGARIHLESSLLFPGLRPGESARAAHDAADPRATLLAADGAPLAEGAARTSPDPRRRRRRSSGRSAPIPAAERIALRRARLSEERQGRPRRAGADVPGPAGRTARRRIAGRRLVAGDRTLARRRPSPLSRCARRSARRWSADAIGRAGRPLRRHGGHEPPHRGLGGARRARLLGAPQPPGSTMKIITATAALQAGLVKLSTEFPEQSGATIDGYTLQNAGGEACGGTLLNAFATSCNSVFAPLGARLGATRLVATAQRFGFNQPTLDPRRGRVDDPVGQDDRIGALASAPRRSARAWCWPPRSRWPTWRRRSPTAAGGRFRPCRRRPGRASSA